MFALWNPARFTAVTSHETREDALLDDQDEGYRTELRTFDGPGRPE